MSSFWINHQANSSGRAGIQPSQTSFADEVCATVARIFLYVGTLALFGILSVHLWNKSHDMPQAEPAARVGWSVADRSRPAFSVSQMDQSDRSEAYVTLRHQEGGRRDVLRWQDASGRPIAELEIYRPGSERGGLSLGADLAGRMPNADATELEAAGIVESKFGTVALLGRTDARKGAGACLGFVKRIDDPDLQISGLQISGWSCQGDNAPARRAAIGCMLDRLTLLSAGNEPKLGDLFARAELKRGNCAAAGGSDWVTGVENPKLRGTL
jgi:hypothetical protein